MATDGVQRTACVCTMGGVMEDGGEGKITYNGGSRKCMLAREGMGVQYLREMVRKIMGAGVKVDRIWYSPVSYTHLDAADE